MLSIRPAVIADDPRIEQIAQQGDAGADDWYLRIVRAEGRLLVAERDDRVVAYGGVVRAGEAAMVSDLFVAADARGGGIGGRLLAELLDGCELRMTCSSRHPAALAVYQRHGMSPRDRLDYFRAPAVGGGPPLEPAPWSHDRSSLVDQYSAMGATVTADVAVSFGDVVEIHRLCSAEPESVIDAVVRAAPRGATVEVKVLESHALHHWLIGRGFEVFDYDTWCASPGIELDPLLASVDAGLF